MKYAPRSGAIDLPPGMEVGPPCSGCEYRSWALRPEHALCKHPRGLIWQHRVWNMNDDPVTDPATGKGHPLYHPYAIAFRQSPLEMTRRLLQPGPFRDACEETDSHLCGPEGKWFKSADRYPAWAYMAAAVVAVLFAAAVWWLMRYYPDLRFWR